MTFLACGTCQLSMMSNGIPFFEYWVCLLIPAFYAYHWQNKVGEVKGLTGVETCTLALGIFIGSAWSMAGSLLPLAWLGFLILFFRRMFTRNRKVRNTSIGMLMAFTLSACFGVARMKRQGEDYPYGRWQAGEPAHRFFREQAQRDPFPAQKLADLYRTGDSRQAHNVLEVFKMRPGAILKGQMHETRPGVVAERPGVVMDLSALPAELAIMRQLVGKREDASSNDLEEVIRGYETEIKAQMGPPSSP